MSKQFRNCDLNQAYLLPPSLQDWLPEGHLARFVADVVETLDLSAMYATYEEGDGRGLAAYDPRMMVRLLIYAYCRGVPGSRRIERATYEDVAFRYLAADQHPDHTTIADFRKEHLANLSQLFVQVLKLCQQAGLVKLGHVALDGTKVKANASKHKAMSYERMEETEKKIGSGGGGVAGGGGAGGCGGRWEIREGEAGRRTAGGVGAAGEPVEEDSGGEGGAGGGGERSGATEAGGGGGAIKGAGEAGGRAGAEVRRAAAAGSPDPEEAKPEPKAQRNFTDPDSRIMKDGATKEFVQAYNAQAAVDSQAQVIVAAAVTQEANDKQQLVPMLLKVEALTGSKPEQVTADSGYFSEANVTDPRLEGIDLYVPPDRQKHGCEPSRWRPGRRRPRPGSAERMRHKLRTAEGRAVYKLRKAIVEPVFGQIKEARGFRRFLLRG